MAADVGILNVALGLEYEAINAYPLGAQLAKVAGCLAADETMHWTILNIACHSIDANRVGPAHKGVVGRKAGSAVDYDYSPAVRKSSIVWSTVTLDLWLTDPEKTIPGQKMGYSVPDAQDRADLIAWLAQNSRR